MPLEPTIKCDDCGDMVDRHGTIYLDGVRRCHACNNLKQEHVAAPVLRKAGFICAAEVRAAVKARCAVKAAITAGAAA